MKGGLATTGYSWAKREKTRQLIAEMAKPRRRNKFNAVKVTVDGETFDSKREAELYHQFEMLERAGAISELIRQPKFDLIVDGIKIASYRADWSYIEKGARHVVDVKSEATAKKRDFVIIRKLMRACHGIEVEILI